MGIIQYMPQIIGEKSQLNDSSMCLLYLKTVGLLSVWKHFLYILHL